MFCTQCGQRNPDQARFCAQCGSALQGGAPAQPAGGGMPPRPPTPAQHGFAPPPPPSPGWGGPSGPPASPPPAQPSAPFAPPQGAYAPPYGPPPSQAGYGVPPYGPPAPMAPVPLVYGSVPFYGVVRAMEYKGVMPRLFASIVDGFLVSIVMGVLVAILGGVGVMDPQALASGEFIYALSGVYSLLVIALGWGYPILFEGLFGGTIGKLMLGMRVVNAQGGNAGLGRALVRNLMRIIDILPFMYLLGAILVASSDTKQRLGDRVAGTYVVGR